MRGVKRDASEKFKEGED